MHESTGRNETQKKKQAHRKRDKDRKREGEEEVENHVIYMEHSASLFFTLSLRLHYQYIFFTRSNESRESLMNSYEIATAMAIKRTFTYIKNTHSFTHRIASVERGGGGMEGRGGSEKATSTTSWQQ